MSSATLCVVTMRRITTGISSDSMVEVKEGLKEGDQILYDVTGMVTEGMKVMAVPMGSGMAGAAMTDAAAPETGAAVETASEASTENASEEGSSEAVGQETETAGTQTQTDGAADSGNE